MASADAEATVGVRLRRQLDVLAALARSDLRIRYGRGKVRILKWLLDPIFALGIYLALVAVVLDRGDQALGLSLACAIVPFQLLITSVLNALQAVLTRGSIILNMGFSRSLIPLSAVATECVAVLAAFTMLPVMMAVYGVAPTAAILWLPVAVALTVALAVALAFPAAAVGVWYPEMVPFAVSLLRALFFLAPGIIAIDLVTGTAHDLMMFNPFAGIFELFRDALLYGTGPALWELAIPLGFAITIGAFGVWLFGREQAQLAKLVG